MQGVLLETSSAPRSSSTRRRPGRRAGVRPALDDAPLGARDRLAPRLGRRRSGAARPPASATLRRDRGRRRPCAGLCARGSAGRSGQAQRCRTRRAPDRVLRSPTTAACSDRFYVAATAARTHDFGSGRPSASGGIERPIRPVTAISVSTYGSAWKSTAPAGEKAGQPLRERRAEPEQQRRRQREARPPAPEDQRRERDEPAARGHLLREGVHEADRQERAAHRRQPAGGHHGQVARAHDRQARRSRPRAGSRRPSAAAARSGSGTRPPT